MRIAFTTLGCKINQFETEQLRKEVVSSGSTVVPFDSEADVYVINTCSVTAKSDYQCRQAIRAAVRRGGSARVVVTGCYAETRPEEVRNIEGVSAVVGNRDKGAIPELIRGFAGSGRDAGEQAVEPSKARTRGVLKVQDGCDSRCTYCIIPSARGSSRSVAPGDVLASFKELVSLGHPEIVLSGIHVGRYGSDLGTGMDLAGLLRLLLAEQGSARIRLSSIEPREVTEHIIDLLGNGLCRHLHIPLQSGDDGILSTMGRNYDAGFYRGLIDRLAERIPGIALGADVMVGFPGESDKAFRNSLELVERSPLTHLHVFSYSPRPGTPAASMQGQVPEKVKKERSEVLRKAGSRKNLEFRLANVGRRLDTVLEKGADATTACITGVTDNYIKVALKDIPMDVKGSRIFTSITTVTENQTLAVL